jgi:hypothetical protein
MDLREGHFLDSAMAFLTRNGRERHRNAPAEGRISKTIPVARALSKNRKRDGGEG